MFHLCEVMLRRDHLLPLKRLFYFQNLNVWWRFSLFGSIVWEDSMLVLCATLIFTCGQWSRWCERRICHAWLSTARLFLSTFWQEFISISCCIFWMFNRSVGHCFGPSSGWILLRWPAPKSTVENNLLCSNVRWIVIEDNYGSMFEEAAITP